MRSFISSSRTVLAVLAAICLLVFLAVRIVTVQAGYSPAEEKTGPWLSNVARFREMLYAKRLDPSKPTIFVVSGSNGLFSIASDVLAERTGYNVANYALHGSLHPDLLFSQIRDKVRPGDIVLAPLEWEVRDRAFGNQFDYSNYLHHLSRSVSPSWWTLYEIYTSVPLRRWWTGLVEYIYGPEDAKSYWDFYTPESLRYAWERRTGTENYSHKVLTEAGDINLALPMTRATWINKSSFSVPSKLTETGARNMSRWQAYFEGVGARFVVVPPIMFEGNGDQLLSKDLWSRIESIRAAMAETTTPLYCDPVRMVFSSIYRLDTHYHANAQGARLRTLELAECLDGFIKGEDMRSKPFDPQEAVERVKQRLARQEENFGEGEMGFQVRLRMLQSLKGSIEDFRTRTGAYPLTGGNRDWGAPQGLDGWPEAPAAKSDGAVAPHFAYWSNGAGYKLLAMDVGDDCTVVAANWPNMIDPARIKDGDPTQCQAYGYWTPDQAGR